MEAIVKRAEVEAMGEPMTDRSFKGMVVQGLIEEFENIDVMMYRDALFDLPKIQATMRHLRLDNLSRRKESEWRIPGRGFAMSAESVTC